MVCDELVLALAGGDVPLLKKLVSDELDRQIAKIDDIVVSGYRVQSSYHTEEAIGKLKVAILELVRSPLADLERKLGAELVKAVEEPAKVAV